MMAAGANAAKRGVTEPADPTVPESDPEPGTIPYAIPTTSPYTVQHMTAAQLPTPDGTGSAVHPSVKDFGPGKTWNGYRYWMAITGYWQGNDDLENPEVYHSQDGFNWTVPAGVTNPLAPAPAIGAGPYNSDTEIVWDPDGDRIHIYYRTADEAAKTEKIYVMTSTDGSTWTAPALVLSGTGSFTQLLSPTIVRISQGDWRMWVAGGQNMWSAPAHNGPWTKVGPFTMTGAVHNLWHLHIIKYLDVFYMVGDDYGTAGLFPAVSTDGMHWNAGPEFLSSGGWATTPYRSAIQIHPALDKFRLWYSANGPDSWRAAYTHVPKSLWDVLL